MNDDIPMGYMLTRDGDPGLQGPRADARNDEIIRPSCMLCRCGRPMRWRTHIPFCSPIYGYVYTSIYLLVPMTPKRNMDMAIGSQKITTIISLIVLVVNQARLDRQKYVF